MSRTEWGHGQFDYDEEWLNSLHFDMRFNPVTGNLAKGVYRVDGLAGIGASSVAFATTAPDGTQLVIKIEIPRLAFYIRELPGTIAVFPSRDIRAIWRKVTKLIGNPAVDLLVDQYDQLYSSIFHSLHESGFAQLDKLEWENVRSQFLMDFALRTPGMRYRLEDWASGGSSEPKDVQWATRALKSVSRINKTDPDFQPEELLDNPFYVCGGAILEGVFLKDEYAGLIGLLRDTYGPREKDSTVDRWLTQYWAVGSLLNELMDKPDADVESFTDFYNLCDRTLSGEAPVL
jgi:hypothetical protein